MCSFVKKLYKLILCFLDILFEKIIERFGFVAEKIQGQHIVFLSTERLMNLILGLLLLRKNRKGEASRPESE